MKVAIVHEWLQDYSGSERVLEQFLRLYPSADLFCVCDFVPEGERAFLVGRRPITSFIQRLPFAKRMFRSYLPLMFLAMEGHDLSSYDLVISSSHAVSKAVLTGPSQLHLCYCHTPIRYAWDLQHQYLREAGLQKGMQRALTRLALHSIRSCDLKSANGVDQFVANSRFISRRIMKVYRRNSVVIHPPVDVDAFPMVPAKDNYYLTASRMVPYKRVDVVVKAFAQMPDKKLIVVGDGPTLKDIKKHGRPNIEFLGYQKDEQLRSLMSRARAFVFAAEEDFGITVVEAQACGTPVICFGKGGALDSVIAGKTGTFFDEQTPESLMRAVAEFEAHAAEFDCYAIRRNAERFGISEFRKKFADLVDYELAKRAVPVSETENTDVSVGQYADESPFTDVGVAATDLMQMAKSL